MTESIALDKAIKFALRIVALYRYLTETKHEYVLSKQVLFSGSHRPRFILIAVSRPKWQRHLKKRWIRN
jgi:hypothetical protein